MAEEQSAAAESSVLAQHFTMKKILMFTIPAMITAVFSSIYGVVDGLVVSNVGGQTAFGAINLASPIFMIVAAVGFMFGTGGTALVSKILGQGDREGANRAFSLVTYALIIFGIILTVLAEIFYDDLLIALGCTESMLPYCLDYGRIIIPFLPCFMLMFFFQSFSVTAGKAKFGLVIMLISGFTNIIGDIVLVVGVAGSMEGAEVSHFAVKGAAIATAAGLVIGGFIPMIYYFSKNKSLLRLGKPDKKMLLIGKTCSNGMSEFLSNVSSSLVNTVYNGILLFLISDVGVAAYGAISYMNTIFTAVFLGFSIGISPVIGYNFGAQNKNELQNVHKNNLKIIIIFSVIMFALAEALAVPLANIFAGKGENAVLMKDIIVKGMRIFAVSFLLKGINTYTSAFFTALNNGFVSGLLAILRTLVFSVGAVLAVPLICYYALGENVDAGMTGVWWSVNVAEILAVATAFLFLKIKRKKYGY